MPEEYYRRIGFAVMDVNEDKKISEVDLFMLMSMLDKHDVFVNVFAYEWK